MVRRQAMESFKKLGQEGAATRRKKAALAAGAVARWSLDTGLDRRSLSSKQLGQSRSSKLKGSFRSGSGISSSQASATASASSRWGEKMRESRSRVLALVVERPSCAFVSPIWNVPGWVCRAFVLSWCWVTYIFRSVARYRAPLFVRCRADVWKRQVWTDLKVVWCVISIHCSSLGPRIALPNAAVKASTLLSSGTMLRGVKMWFWVFCPVWGSCNWWSFVAVHQPPGTRLVNWKTCIRRVSMHDS